MAKRAGKPWRAYRVAWSLPLIPVVVFLSNYHREDRVRDALPDDYANALLGALPEDAILLTSGDNDIYSAWYLQEVEEYRKDVLVFGANFVLSGWYNSYFQGTGFGRAEGFRHSASANNRCCFCSNDLIAL